MGVYNYKVLRKIEGDGEIHGAAATLVEVGEFKAKEPGLAALAAAEQVGSPGAYIAIPERNFNEVPIIPSTGFMIGEAEPGPPPATAAGEGSGAAGDDLDPRLDQTLPCETEGCSHLPADHGAKGLGICRVDDCPCGQYLPAP